MRLKIAVPMLMILLLCGCGTRSEITEVPVQFRMGLREAGGCTYTVALTADYGDYVREFTLDCDCTMDGSSFTVIEPDSVAGITATVSNEQAQVSYRDTILAVESFSTRAVSPMAVPFLLTKAWSEGYISAVGEPEQVEYLLGFGTDELVVSTVFDENIPAECEVSDGTSTLITCQITEFKLK